jgi:hypothetical protein
MFIDLGYKHSCLRSFLIRVDGLPIADVTEEVTMTTESCPLATPGCRPWTVRVTSVVDGVDHEVTDEDMSVGLAAGLGTFRAVCGVTVTSDALPAPPGRLCPRCWATSHPPVARRSVDVPTARQGWWRGWMTSVSARHEAAPGWLR